MYNGSRTGGDAMIAIPMKRHQAGIYSVAYKGHNITIQRLPMGGRYGNRMAWALFIDSVMQPLGHEAWFDCRSRRVLLDLAIRRIDAAQEALDIGQEEELQ